MEELPIFSSCRGVSFEIAPPRQSPFAVQPSTMNLNSQPAWHPHQRFGSRRVITFGDLLDRSMSRASSHFCDLEALENDVIREEVEEQKLEVVHVEKDQLPPPTESAKASKESKPSSSSSRLSVILLDQGLFTVYKRLFLLSFTINLIMLLLAIVGRFPYARKRTTVFAIGNILALTLCRSEAFLRLVFWAAVKILSKSWIPVLVKTGVTALLQSVGGIHSACGVSSILWLVYALVLAIKNPETASPAIILVAFVILSLLFLSALAAFPIIRHLWHNSFEHTHRIAGWSALALLWCFVFLTAAYHPETKSYSFSTSSLVKSQEFWFTLAITLLIILPWLTIRKVEVRHYAPTSHASVMKFHGGIQAGILGRISRSPLSDWHAFGIISDGKAEHMMLAGAVGDFTKGLVSNPPTHLWIRSLHFAGLPYLINMYNRVLLVATGSGICVFLSFLIQPTNADVYLIWVAKGMEKNFGKEIMSMLGRYPENKMILHDTASQGRPNIGEMTVEAAKKWHAEVVVVTSNPEGSRDIVNKCKSSGVPAFGPIWDS